MVLRHYIFKRLEILALYPLIVLIYNLLQE